MTIDFAAIRERVDLVELVAAHGVELKRCGRKFRGLCPFHGEKTASFYVNPELGAFYCFGCGAKGDAIGFLRMIDGLSLEEALERLGGNGTPAPRTRPVRMPATEAPRVDAAALWSRLPERDDQGESYLTGRGLLYRDPDVLRFNVGGSGDSWLDEKARDGYRAAFAVRRPDGAVQTISLRHVSPGNAPNGKKTLALFGCPTSGAAIVSPAIEGLASGDPEFAADRILVLEGGTSWLGASALFAQGTADLNLPPTWPLGAIGVAQAAGAVTAFAKLIRWRAVLIGLDADRAGREAVPEVIRAARRANARSVLPVNVPLRAKDWGDLARMEYAHG